MKLLFRAQRLLGCIHNTKVRRQSVWTQDIVVNSQYNDVEIPNVTVPEYIWQNLDKWADRTAVVCGISNRSYTYQQLHGHSQNFAATLRTHLHIKNGDVIGLMIPTSVEYPIAVIGAMQAGAVVTTIIPIYTASQVHRQLLRVLAKPKLIISSPEIFGIVKEAVRMTKTKIVILIVNKPDEDLPLDYRTCLDYWRTGWTGLTKGVEITNRNKLFSFAWPQSLMCFIFISALFLGTNSKVKKEHLVSLDRLVCAAAPISKSDIRRVLEKCQVGELHIRGPHVMKGYRDNPEATKTAITDDGWLKSGDLVSINGDGAVTIVDRIKELIKVKGHQVPPAELEDVSKEHPDILDAAVVGIPDDKKGEVPKAFIVLKEGSKTSASNIKEFVSKKVTEYKKIKEVEFLDALPRYSSRKLLRRVLKNNNYIS